jgi:hypothetical protein
MDDNLAWMARDLRRARATAIMGDPQKLQELLRLALANGWLQIAQIDPKTLGDVTTRHDGATIVEGPLVATHGDLIEVVRELRRSQP